MVTNSLCFNAIFSLPTSDWFISFPHEAELGSEQIDCQHFLQHDNPDALVLAILCDFKGQDPRLIVRRILQRLQNHFGNNESGLREYFGMLEILSGNRKLQTIVSEEEEMLSAIQLSDLPSYQKGRQAGLQEGRQAGFSEGEQRGEYKLLLRQLKKKFGVLPEAIEQRLIKASSEELEQWGDNVLSAEMLSQVFGDE